MIESFIQVVSTLLPFILLIGLGGGLKWVTLRNARAWANKAGDLSSRAKAAPDWKMLDWLCYWVLNPALLFTAASARPVTLDKVLENSVWVWLLMISALLLILPWKKLVSINAVEFASRAQTAWRFNSVVGLAATSIISPDAMQAMAIFIGATVPLANFLAVAGLSLASGERDRSALNRTAKSILLNPFLLASGAGLLVGLTVGGDTAFMSYPLVAVLYSTANLVAQAAIPMSLIAVGTAVLWKDLFRVNPLSIYVLSLQLIILPGLALGLSLAFGIAEATAIALIVFGALPTSTSSHILGAAYGARRGPTALIVSQSTVLACLGLPFWIMIAQII